MTDDTGGVVPPVSTRHPKSCRDTGETGRDGMLAGYVSLTQATNESLGGEGRLLLLHLRFAIVGQGQE